MFTLAFPENFILNEIKDQTFKREDIALTYAIIIKNHQEEVDIKKINNAIIDRWSKSGLEFIKTKAWKIAQQKNI